MVFCRACYMKLPSRLRVALYRQYGHGFEAAYAESLQFLTTPKP
jgi:hypothetical protein